MESENLKTGRFWGWEWKHILKPQEATCRDHWPKLGQLK